MTKKDKKVQSDSKKLPEMNPGYHINQKLFSQGNMKPFKQQMYWFDRHPEFHGYFIVDEKKPSLGYGLGGEQAHKPIAIHTETVLKIEQKHHLPLWKLGRLSENFENTVLMLESRARDNAKIVIFDWMDWHRPVMASMEPSLIHNVDCTFISSVYPRNNIQSFLTFSYLENLEIYKKENSFSFFRKNEIDLPFELAFALSELYPKNIIKCSEVQEYLERHYGYTIRSTALPKESDVELTPFEKQSLGNALRILGGHYHQSYKNYLIVNIPDLHIYEAYSSKEDVIDLVRTCIIEQNVIEHLNKSTVRFFNLDDENLLESFRDSNVRKNTNMDGR